MSIRWGISAGNHNAALAVFDGNELVYASENERFSRIKSDGNISQELVDDATTFGEPSEIIFYERSGLVNARRFISGQHHRKLSLPCHITSETDHHKSHAAMGFFTSGMENAAILVMDSIGEFDTTSIWSGDGQTITKVWSQQYPDSIGLWYSAMTQRVGLKPNEEEYIFMGMAAYGDYTKFYDKIKNDLFVVFPTSNDPTTKFVSSLHNGCLWWGTLLLDDFVHVAAATQKIYEEILLAHVTFMQRKLSTDNIILSGGCAMNCVANGKLLRKGFNVHIPLDPGDAGAAVGAAIVNHTILSSPYLGFNIGTSLDINSTISLLLRGDVVPVAHGRAEFGPRALGNRSLVADPRISTIKYDVNKIKGREQFRPFSPMILEEYAHEYFELDAPASKYNFMQYVVKCKTPSSFPGIVHIDNTSRIQTVPNDGSPIRLLLEKWYRITNCPMLLNTSLNVKGEPLVNSMNDYAKWEIPSPPRVNINDGFIY